MKAINLPHFKLKLRDMSRRLFLEHGWEMPRGLIDPFERDPLNYERAEGQQAKRVKQDPKALKALFRQCWERSDSKAAFARALKEHGFILAQGDRRGFVAVDGQGEVFAVSRWVGEKAQVIRARLGEPSDLPGVDEALGLFEAELSEETRRKAAKGEADYERRLAAFERKRRDLIERQRLARRDLRVAQGERRIEEAKAFRSKAPSGWRGVWAKITGQHKKLLQESAASLAALRERDALEQQKLIATQLKERRALGHEMQQLRLHRGIEAQTLCRILGEDLRDFDLDRTGQLPAIDPKQPLIIEDDESADDGRDIRRKPERILDVLSRNKEFFSRNDIVRGLAAHIDDPLRLRLAIDLVLQSKELIAIESAPRQRFTTVAFHDCKVSLAETVGRIARTSRHSVADKAAGATIAEQNAMLRRLYGGRLGDEQERAIRHVLGPRQIAAIVGLAGAGKSTALTAARAAWERQGFRVLGAALSGKAASGLESASGIACRTLASLEYSWEQGFQNLSAKDVLVIDEAGMVGTRQLSRIASHVRKSGAKLVLVGDPEQLQPIEAGRPFKEITEVIDAARLTDIRRQKNDWQRDASIKLAEQQTAQALDSYRDRGFVTVRDTTSSAISSLVEDYMRDVERHGQEASRLALAHRRKDVHLINQTIRAARKSAGELTNEKLFVTRHGPRAFAAGDRILFTRNDRELGLFNGMLGTVEKVEKDRVSVLIDADGGKPPTQKTLSTKRYQAIEHGYATTIHKSQGATVDQAFVLASTRLDRHMTYVALTRHRDEVRLYADGTSFEKLKRLDSAKPAEQVFRSRDRHRHLRRDH